MTDKELRKLRRDDLLQILINQQKQIDELKAELQRCRQALADRDLAVQESGTLAEAALKLNGVFEAAQSAADDYLAQMQRRADDLAAEAEARSKEAVGQADALVKSARAEAVHIVEKARADAEALVGQARGAAPAPSPSAADMASGEEAAGKRRHGFLWRNRST